MRKVLQEWYIPAPWGRLALISWGKPTGSPVLLVHGRQDSAATFIPLLELLPDDFYYVAVDMPGNGKSDPYPIGVQIMRFHFVGAIEVVLKHLQWKRFVYIGHSMGCEQGLFYNAIYPGRIQKFIHLDAGPSLQRLQIQNLQEFYDKFYHEYYSNYSKITSTGKVYSKEGAVAAVMRARGLSEKQAEIILSRNLIKVGENQYRLSWDKRLKLPAPQTFPVDYYYKIFSMNSPPSILIAASEGGKGYENGKEATKKLISDLETNLVNFIVVKVEGTHDVHVTDPERFSSELSNFLKNDFVSKSKL